MKKLFISCPVAERNYDDVVKSFTKMHMIAEAVFEQELKVINTASELKIDGQIGKSEFADRIKLLTDADYFIGVRDCWGYEWRHCDLELGLARQLEIPVFALFLDDIAKDCGDIIRGKMPVEAAIQV